MVTTLQQGGKADKLKILLAAGYPVPPFMVISREEYDRDMPGIIAALKTRFPENCLFAVRSSASVEDGNISSYAGQFASFLQVPIEQVAERVADVFDSAHKEQVKAYASSRKENTAIKMFVIIQQMVSARLSGIAFGMDPVSGDMQQKVINITEGYGELLAKGEINGETYKIGADHTIIQKGVLLEEAEIRVISDTLDALRQLFEGLAQDIEFAFEGQQFYLLQSRPVSTIPQASQQTEIIWDNSNIVESYPGMTLPLTFSFIEKMYEAVYKQLSLVLGISPKTVNRHQDVFANMLGLLNGRVYYNLNSWYTCIALLPGYALNADFMEKMMGVKEKMPIDFSGGRKKNIREYLSVFKALAGLLKQMRQAEKNRQAFIHNFEKVYHEFSSKDYKTQNIPSVIKDYTRFEQLMVKEWKAPLVNDLFAMIYFGLLQKMSMSFGPYAHNTLVAGSNDIITTEPLRLIPQLARTLYNNSALRKVLQEGKPSAIWEQLQKSQYHHERACVEAYIEDWGDRALAELKLETITYRQKPEDLIALVQNHVRHRNFTYRENPNVAEERKELENTILRSFKGKWLKSRVFQHVLKKARYFVSNRENLRYYRTKAFGTVRRMMLGIGEQLSLTNRLDKASDIFYLRLEEVLSLDQGAQKDLGSLIDQRKAEYRLLEQYPLPERIRTQGKKSYILQNFDNTKDPESQAAQEQLNGIPCSAGIVKAKVSVIHDISSVQNIHNTILATYSTDPGWVVALSSCLGILTERGSSLSHAAIVSREMGIPCIVGIENLLKRIKGGDELIMDGSTGIVQIVSSS